MRSTATRLILAATLLFAVTVSPATVTWDGDAGDFIWHNPANWSGDAVPRADDDAVIDVPGEVTIVSGMNVSIQSLSCQNNLSLTGGTFGVTAGSSVIEGNFSTEGGPTLSATGPDTTFVCNAGVDANGASFEASNGASLSLPNLVSYSKGPGCAFVNWRATGPNSALDLPGLANLTGATCANLSIHASSGGRILLPNLTTINDGILSILADGPDSHVDLAALTESQAITRTVAFESRNSGTLTMPRFPGGSTVTIALRSGGILPVTQLRQLSGFIVDGMTADFPSLTNLVSDDVLVDGGAVVTLAALERHQNEPGCVVNSWRATGPNSVLSFPNLISLAGPDCGSLSIRATAGGTILLDQLPVITEGALNVLADGAGSRVHLDTLELSTAVNRIVRFESRNGGTVHIPMLPGGPMVAVTLQSGGVLPVSQLTQLKGLSVAGMTVGFPALTNLHKADVSISQGAVVTLPNQIHHDQGDGCAVNNWDVTGAGSRLELPALRQLTGSPCGRLSIRGLAGGAIALNQLVAVTEGTLIFMADGADSLVSLESLEQSTAALYPVTFEASHNGSIHAPFLAGGPTVTIAIRSGGSLPVGQLRSVQSLIVSDTTLDLTDVTQFLNGNLTVGEGAILRLPGLLHHDQGDPCAVNTWTVSGNGSLLDLSALTNLVGGRCGYLTITAANAGVADLRHLSSITEGSIIVRSDGPGSHIDLRSLERFLSPSAASIVTATNGGDLLLNKSGTVFSGVHVELTADTPGLPETSIAATNLALYATPWHSYRLEYQDRAAPSTPWNLFRRVPLTNTFQNLGKAAPPGFTIRTIEFIADPFAIELTTIAGSGVQPVLYGPPGITLLVQTSDTPHSPETWFSIGSFPFTNSFRILPTEPLTTPLRFFQVDEP
jgi:hypothetical protein